MRASFGGLHRRLDGGVARHHQHAQVGMRRAQPWQKLQASFAGHHHVEQHQVERRRRKLGISRCRIARHFDGKTFDFQSSLHRREDIGLVVND